MRRHGCRVEMRWPPLPPKKICWSWKLASASGQKRRNPATVQRPSRCQSQPPADRWREVIQFDLTGPCLANLNMWPQSKAPPPRPREGALFRYTAAIGVWLVPPPHPTPRSTVSTRWWPRPAGWLAFRSERNSCRCVRQSTWVCLDLFATPAAGSPLDVNFNVDSRHLTTKDFQWIIWERVVECLRVCYELGRVFVCRLTSLTKS